MTDQPAIGHPATSWPATPVVVVEIDLARDSPAIEVAPGVEVRHVVTERLMLREVTLEPATHLDLREPAAEHVVVGLDGVVAVEADGRINEARSGGVVVVRGAATLRLTANPAGARCQVTSSPPDPALVRHLVHLEHEGHGFD